MSPLPWIPEAARFGFALIGVLVPCLLASILARIAWRKNGARRLAYALGAALTAAAGLAAFWALVHDTVARIYRSQADLAYREGNLASAQALYVESLLWQDDLATRDRLARALLANGNLPEVQAMLADIRRRRAPAPPSPLETYLWGVLDFFAERPASAVHRLEPVVDHGELGWNARLLLSILYFEQGRPAAAMPYMAAFRSIPATRPDHTYLLALLAEHERRSDEAKALVASFPPGTLSPFWERRMAPWRPPTATAPPPAVDRPLPTVLDAGPGWLPMTASLPTLLAPSTATASSPATAPIVQEAAP